MTRAQWDDASEQDYDPIVFHDGRGDDDSLMLSDSLDTFSLSIDALD